MNLVEIFEKASRLHKNGNLAEAEKLYRKVLEEAPDNAKTIQRLGVVAFQNGRLEEAETLISKAIRINPRVAAFHYNLGNVLSAKNNFESAAAAYQHALRLDPKYAAAYLAFAGLHRRRGDLTAALKFYQGASQALPDHPDILYEFATALAVTRYHQRALRTFQRLLQLAPDNVAALAGVAGVQLSCGELLEAEKGYRKALDREPANPVLHYNLALALSGQKRLEEAAASLQRAIEIDPQHEGARYELATLRFEACDWRQRAEDEECVRNYFEKRVQDSATAARDGLMIRPWTLTQFDSGRELQAAAAEAYATALTKSVAALRAECDFNPSKSEYDNDSPLRVGFLSADFRTHAVGMLVKDLFRHLDPSRIRTFAYSLAESDDAINRAVRESCHVYRDVSKVSPRVAAKTIYDDKVHVLVDMAGYTTFSRPEIAALQPAPVQVSYLGYLCTMGAPFMDYVIADATVVDDALAETYTEKIVYLPESFAPACPLEIADNRVSKSDAGLPEDAFVYCCFCTPYKIEPRVFDVWMRTLHRVRKSVLWVHTPEDGTVIANLEREAEARGVDPQRIVNAPRLPMDEHLARLNAADLFLDTFVYNAGATAVTALWAGLPILTLYGSTLLSRMGASILTAAGLSELVARSPKDYEELAVNIGQNPGRAAKFRSYLKETVASSTLFDTKRYAAHFESALESIWRNYGQDRREHIHVRPE